MLVEPGGARQQAGGPEDRAAPAVGRRNYPLLNGVRAVAALMVVGYHVQLVTSSGTGTWNPAEQLNTGVTIFFVLSGFLLYRPFLAARLVGSRPPDVRRYLTRRLLRVVPAYWVALTVLGMALPAVVTAIGPDWWVFYTLAQTWVPFRMFDGLSPAWSLSVEASFYLLLPLYAAGLALLARHMATRVQIRVEWCLLAVTALVALLLRQFVFDRGDGPLGFLVWSLLGHLDWFAAGLALALASVVWEGSPRRPWWVRSVERRGTLCWLVAALLIAALGFVHGSPGDLVHVVSLLIAVLVVAPAVFGDGEHGMVRRFLGWRVTAWLGLVSFGIFLWNEPLMLWMHEHRWDDWSVVSGAVALLVLTVIASAAAGWLSFVLVERPAMALAVPAAGGRRRRLPPTE
jgi:peptidoglycan/LPS O-acetylase OafA/YrhL